MKHSVNSTNFFALTLSIFFSLNLNAQTQPEPVPHQPMTPTELVCGATGSFHSAQHGATRDSNNGNVFKLAPQAGSSDKRATTSGVVTLERGHEFAFSLTWIPRASNLVRGEDLMNATVRYQRRQGDKVVVLAESILNSDQITNFGELQSRRYELTIAGRFNNPEVATIKVNRGQLPDGITTIGTFDCAMQVGNAPD